MSTCPGCLTPVTKNYCPNCGQPAKLKRIDGHYIIHEIEHVLHFEKGILYTVKGLLIRPGENVKEFITKNRSRLVKPIIFIIITSLIYTLTNHFFKLEEGYVNVVEDKKTSITVIFNWIKNNYGYSNILLGIFIALWLKLFFRKHNYNFFEILILLCFVMGMGMLLLAVFTLIEGLTKLPLMTTASMILLLYLSWAIGQFFDKARISSYVKSLAAYLLGMITFYGAAMALGFLFDMIFKPGLG